MTGYILPVEEIFEIAKEYGAVTIMDASQSFGLLDIDIKKSKQIILLLLGIKLYMVHWEQLVLLIMQNYHLIHLL